ncbi:unnamed protein product [Penicillium roqueforti FM164]|uniref:Genomic scaffold, ProqFM164S03 n=1 Tax=Penicillium roqueforti (strain FM164) TaxID=1365484 RepID=W6QC36_PENRF|nr:unnamed protein product [Penicillium roqueforti FM164]
MLLRQSNKIKRGSVTQFRFNYLCFFSPRALKQVSGQASSRPSSILLDTFPSIQTLE